MDEAFGIRLMLLLLVFPGAWGSHAMIRTPCGKFDYRGSDESVVESTEYLATQQKPSSLKKGGQRHEDDTFVDALSEVVAIIQT